MRYTSTRDARADVSSSQAIARGISPEGGLYLPKAVPSLSLWEIKALAELDYIGRAEHILSKFLTAEGGWTRDELDEYIRAAYTGTFADPAVAPLRDFGADAHILELFHGPTCAFKDLALQLLPRLLVASAAKAMDGDKEILILTATSGDTGKAALEGFKDVPGTRILVFYPIDGVSAVQKRQMSTQEGGNVRVVGVIGNFDDAQTGVKAIFANENIGVVLNARGRTLSSANSINWGRLAPQIVYYVSAYCDLLRAGNITAGEPINFVVPTGNFGNILAAYYAKRMGLPIKKLVCASNQNRVLTDFFETGVYNRNRPFHTTSSPSMDILISSNLERLLYLAARGDAEQCAGWMRQLAHGGRYAVPGEILRTLQTEFAAGSCDEAQCAAAIANAWEQHKYLSDTHTAVALHVLEEYRARTYDYTRAVVVSTASPFKFAGSVLGAIGAPVPQDEFDALEALEAATGVPCPAPLRGLRDKPVRFTEVCAPARMAEYTRW
ncbi:MAG: threonine synthase [Oscillospiraceae bacterium]|nr:threonine synthase [Oscillospiraceae bacterium]MCL1952235.1 threonine synthase [Oscillospiraceae bacterium]